MKTRSAWVVVALVIIILAFVPDARARAATSQNTTRRVAIALGYTTQNQQKPVLPITQIPWSKSYIEGVAFTNTDSVANYFKEVSYGHTTITGSVFDNQGDWYSLPPQVPGNDGQCPVDTFMKDVVAAVDRDIDFNTIDTLVYSGEPNGCIYHGWAYEAKIPVTSHEGQKSLNFIYSGMSSIHHEMAHAFKLGHAAYWQCPSPAIVYGNCTVEEYGDPYDVLGHRGLYQINGPHKLMAGWIRGDEVATATKDGMYTLGALERNDANPRLLKIPQAIDNQGRVTGWYYLEYRQPIGFDSRVAYPGLTDNGIDQGVLVHFTLTEANWDKKTWLLDMQRGTCGADFCDQDKSALPFGSTYTDARTDVSFTPIGGDGTTVSVRVSFAKLRVGQPTVAPPDSEKKIGSCTIVQSPTKTDATHVYTLNPAHTLRLNQEFEALLGRSARCDELQFHVNHKTTTAKLHSWLVSLLSSRYKNLRAFYEGRTLSTSRNEWFLVNNGVLHRIPDWLTAMSWGMLLDERINVSTELTAVFYKNTTLGAPLQFSNGPYVTAIAATRKDKTPAFSGLPPKVAEETNIMIGYDIFSRTTFPSAVLGKPWKNLLDWRWMLNN